MKILRKFVCLNICMFECFLFNPATTTEALKADNVICWVHEIQLLGSPLVMIDQSYEFCVPPIATST